MKKKIMAVCMSVSLLGISLIPTLISASDDKWGFSFYVKPYQANETTGYRYRETKNPNNPWKVALESSEEGKGTITTFWLEKLNGTNVSASVNVKQGAGPYRNGAYNDACQTNVVLAAQNNNYNSATYRVSGHWDEETW